MKVEREPYFTLEAVQKLYPNVRAIHGPYLRNDGRLMLVLVNKYNNDVSSISYPKLLYEIYYNKRIDENDTIDHIDGNPLNNDINNLRVLDRNFHIRMDVRKRIPNLVKCKECGKEFLATKSNNAKRTGYFCSRQCSGKYGKKIQLNLIKKEYVDYINHECFCFHDLYEYEDNFGNEFSLENSNNEYLEGYTEFK